MLTNENKRTVLCDKANNIRVGISMLNYQARGKEYFWFSFFVFSCWWSMKYIGKDFSVKNQWIGTRTVCSLQWACNDSSRKWNVHGYFTAWWFYVTDELALVPLTTWIDPRILFLGSSWPIKNQDIHRPKNY